MGINCLLPLTKSLNLSGFMVLKSFKRVLCESSISHDFTAFCTISSSDPFGHSCKLQATVDEGKSRKKEKEYSLFHGFGPREWPKPLQTTTEGDFVHLLGFKGWPWPSHPFVPKATRSFLFFYF
jgi:hypothetical protein